jgi:zinc transporter
VNHNFRLTKNDRMIRYIEEIDEVRDRAALAQEELLTRVSEQINERSYLFTIVATIFLPLSFFTGLMGINVGGMPGFCLTSGRCPS